MKKTDILANNVLNEASKAKLEKCYDNLSKKEYSDILDKEENQYVHFVQEGGGVWGTALIGYLYALESFGIRFLRIAGTSAGAINTILIAATGKNSEAKSGKIKDIFFKWSLPDFIDGKAIVKRILNNIIGSKIKLLLLAVFIGLIFITSLLFPFLAIIFNWKLYVYIISFALLMIAVLVLIAYYRLFKKYRFGLNPGNAFTKAMTESMNKENGDVNKLFSIKDLNTKYNTDAVNLGVRHRLGDGDQYFKKTIEEIKNLHDQFSEHINQAKYNRFMNNLDQDYANPLLYLKADYTIVTTDINAKIKVELPKMANLYWTNKDMENESPSSFVRCSMAIPFFFEPYIKKIDSADRDVQNAAQYWLNSSPDYNHGVFIDGGSISNFPIDIFHEREILYPRVPVFGARLFETKKPAVIRRKYIERFFRNLLAFGGQIINTMRGFNDRSFLQKYSFYSKHSIKEVDCAPSNWLNFFMKEKEKKNLYNQGFQAGLDFLEKLNWAEYKRERMILALKERNIITD